MLQQSQLTPHEGFTLGPLAFPDRGLDAVTEVTTLVVSETCGIAVDGHLAGVGRRYRYKTVTMFRTGDLATVFIDDQMVREFIIDRTRHYQPQNR